MKGSLNQIYIIFVGSQLLILLSFAVMVKWELCVQSCLVEIRGEEICIAKVIYILGKYS